MDELVLEKVRGGMKGVRVPGASDKVFKEECLFSFDSPESEGGLYISLSSFQGFGKEFVQLDHERTGNVLYLHEKWRRKSTPENLALGGEGGFNVGQPQFRLEKSTTLVVMPGQETVPLPCPDLPELVLQSVTAITAHESSSAQDTVALWEEERRVSKYADNVQQLDTGRKISPNPKDWKCDETNVTENLWLNLSTGFIGSGRQNWDGSGGNGAALRHFEATGSRYPLVVKLGTITPHGADVYSYAPDENDMVLDPHLDVHLTKWGINMMQMEKTEKTMTELQVQLNLTHEYNKITESGTALTPLSGAGFVLLGIPEVQERYAGGAAKIFQTAPPEPQQDFACQMAKLGVALSTGRTGHVIQEAPPCPDDADAMEVDDTNFKDERIKSVRPLGFKTLVGRGHQEFSSARQQDALEYFQYVLEQIGRCEHANTERLDLASGPSTKSLFGFTFEDRIQCLGSGGILYKQRDDNVLSLDIPLEAAVNKEEVEQFKDREAKRLRLKEELAEAYIGAPGGSDNTSAVVASGVNEEPVLPKVSFAACLERFGGAEIVDDVYSALAGSRTSATKRVRMTTMPPYLMVALKRYYVAEGWVPKKMEALVEVPDQINIENLRGSGPQPGEVLQPEDAPGSAPGGAGGGAAPPMEPDPLLVSQLVSMGFDENGCKRATLATNNSGAEAAMEYVLAHMEDPGFNDPFVPASTAAAPAAIIYYIIYHPLLFPYTASSAAAPAASGGAADPEKISKLADMGFSETHATAALKTCGDNIERAADWLFSHMDDLDSAVASVLSSATAAAATPAGAAGGSSGSSQMKDGPGNYELMGIISHMGSNTACGHYVCHMKKDGRWVIFNDEKVAVSEHPPKDLGYMYLFKRLQE
eukprot:gene30886-35934_t